MIGMAWKAPILGKDFLRSFYGTASQRRKRRSLYIFIRDIFSPLRQSTENVKCQYFLRPNARNAFDHFKDRHQAHLGYQVILQ
jgi:hypothetical protein